MRGDYDALLASSWTPQAGSPSHRRALYDAAAAEFAGFFASRRNYDIARAATRADAGAAACSSSRGASAARAAAEVAALEAFRADPALRRARVLDVEVYGAGASRRRRAIVHFHGVDRASVR